MQKLDIIVAMHTKNDCYKKATPIKPVGIIWHSTAANNPYLKRYVDAPDKVGVNPYGNHWNRPASQMGSVCVHAFIGLDIENKIRVAQILPYDIACWGNGSTNNGNCNYNPTARIQFEMCEDNRQSAEFLKNMCDIATQYCAELCIKYGWDPLGTINGVPVIMDHAESYKYKCGSNHSDVSHWLKPHGMNMDMIRQEIKRKVDILRETPAEKPVQPVTPPPSTLLSAEAIAKEVINGKWGNGDDRKKRLTAAGYNASNVQDNVNAMMSKKPLPYPDAGGSAPVAPSTPAKPSKKSNEEIAKEVIKGNWGNGADRKAKLSAAGYDPSTIQALVNKMI